MSDDAAFELTVEIVRGKSASNRDKQRAKVSANSIEELDEKVEALRDRMERWADDFRRMQPVKVRHLDDDQSTLEEAEA